MTLHGRSELLRTIGQSTGPVQVLFGPPGVGKSAVLDAAREETDLAPEVLPLRWESTSFQSALLTALADAVVLATRREGGVATAVGHVMNAVESLGRKTGRQLAQQAGQALLGVLRQKIGAEAVDLLIGVAKEVIVSVEQRLEARLRSTIDASLVEAIVEFSRELTEQFEGTSFVLSIDNAERLTDDSFRILLDLIPSLPTGLSLRIGYAVSGTADEERINRLRAAGAVGIEVLPLAKPDIEEWLDAEGIELDVTKALLLTAGYPLHLQGLVRHLRDGGSIDQLPVDNTWVTVFKIAFDRLSRGDRGHAERLAALSFPPPFSTVTSLLGLTLIEWQAFQAVMRRAGVFVVTIEGTSWFHELHRRAIWESLDGASKSQIATDVLRALEAGVTHDGVFHSASVGDVLRLLPEAPELLAERPALRVLLDGSLEAIGLLAALLELGEPRPDEPGFVDGEILLAHAFSAFSLDIPLADVAHVVEILSDAKLVYWLENDRASVATLTLPGFLAHAIVAARAGAELGRYPIQRLATRAFESFVRPNIGAFELAHFGVGRPNAGGLASMPYQDRDPARIMARGRESVLGLKAVVGGVPFYASIVFKLEGDCVAGEVSLRDASYGEDFRIVALWPFPTLRQPTERFPLALKAALGGDISKLQVEDLDTYMQLKADLIGVVRQRSGPIELEAFGLTESSGSVYEGDSRSWLEAEVRGGNEVVRLERAPTRKIGELFFMTELARAAGLTSEQSIGLVTVRMLQSGLVEPAKDAMDQLRTRASEFNNSQNRVTVPTDPGQLEIQLADAYRTFEADVEAFRAALTQRGYATPEPLEPTELFVCVGKRSLDPEVFGLGAIEFAVVVRFSLPPGSGSVVHVASSDEKLDLDGDGKEWAATVFGITPSGERLGWSRGDFIAVLSDLLGFQASDLRIDHPLTSGSL